MTALRPPSPNRFGRGAFSPRTPNAGWLRTRTKGFPIALVTLGFGLIGLQGAEEGTEEASLPWSELTVTPALRGIAVEGDEKGFREQFWTREGMGGGLDRLHIQGEPGDEQEIELDGHLRWPERDIELKLRYDRLFHSYVEIGFDQQRKYFDDTGGFYAPFSPPAYDLDKDLHLDTGKVWLEAGLTQFEIPEMSIRYEYAYKKGRKSTLQWGPVTEDERTRRIFPAFKEIDEDRHILEYRIGDEVDEIDLVWEDTIRLEFTDMQTERRNASLVRSGATRPDKLVEIDEGHQHVQGSNTLQAEKRFTDWLLASTGYLYSRLDAEASYDATSLLTSSADVPPTTALDPDDPFWSGDAIVLDRESHILTGGSLLGPWKGLSFSSGIQSEWVRQEGFGDVRLDSGDPGGTFVEQPATLDADLDKLRVEENFNLRYTGLPWTTLFLDTRFRQEHIGQREAQFNEDREAFLRDTDHTADLKSYKAGFSLSPWTWTSLHVHYKHSLKQNDYDHRRDRSSGSAPSPGYSAFIRARDIDSDSVEVKWTWRILTPLKATFKYQLTASDFHTDTDPLGGGNLSPGGRHLAGNHDAHTGSVNLTWTPWRQLHLSAGLSSHHSRTKAENNGSPAVVSYQGDTYSLNQNLHWAMTPETDLELHYSYSITDYEQGNEEGGLPLGLAFARHSGRVGINHRLKENVTGRLQYAVHQYDETSTGGGNDFTAHGVFGSVGLQF